MDGHEFVGLNGTLLINRLTNDIDDSTKGATTNGDGNGLSSVDDILASNESLGGIKGNSSDVGTSKMLGDLKNESVVDTLDLEGVEDRWKGALELHIDDGTNNLRDLTSGCESS